MCIRKNTLWRVPAYCVVAGLIASRLIIPVFYPAVFIVQSDGSTKRSIPRELVLYGIIFAVVFFVGWLFFHRMTRKEIFWSASVLAMTYLVITLLAQLFKTNVMPLWTLFLYITEIWEWCGFISYLLYWGLGGTASIISALTPFIFVPFGVSNSNSDD